MQIVYLGIVFAVIIILLAFKRPLYQAILGGTFGNHFVLPDSANGNCKPDFSGTYNVVLIFCTVIAVSHYVFTENFGIPRPDPSGAAEFKCGFS